MKGLGVDFTPPFQRKGRTGAEAQQTPQTVALVRLDAQLGIDREAAAVLPLGQHLRIVRRQQAAPQSRAQPPLVGGQEKVQCGVQNRRIAFERTSASAWAPEALTGALAGAG